MMQPSVQTGIAILFSVCLSQGCDPGYWVGVRANLKEPLSPECIENTLRKLPEIDKLMIHKSDPRDAWYLPRASMVQPPPDQYRFEAGDNKGVITQFEKQEGRTNFLAGVNGMGPAQERMEDMQLFNARIAIHVAQACHARFSDDTGFLCTPDRLGCREALESQTVK